MSIPGGDRSSSEGTLPSATSCGGFRDRISTIRYRTLCRGAGSLGKRKWRERKKASFVDMCFGEHVAQWVEEGNNACWLHFDSVVRRTTKTWRSSSVFLTLMSRDQYRFDGRDSGGGISVEEILLLPTGRIRGKIVLLLPAVLPCAWLLSLLSLKLLRAVLSPLCMSPTRHAGEES